VIYGEKGIARLLEDPGHSLVIQYTTGEVTKFDLGAIQTNDEGGQTTSEVIDRFVDAVQNNRENPVPGPEGMKSLLVILAALESQETKQIVSVQEGVKVTQ
jgi:UDP-N-acetylglucosamine 3-dehydrogenase